MRPKKGARGTRRTRAGLTIEDAIRLLELPHFFSSMQSTEPSSDFSDSDSAFHTCSVVVN